MDNHGLDGLTFTKYDYKDKVRYRKLVEFLERHPFASNHLIIIVLSHLKFIQLSKLSLENTLEIIISEITLAALEHRDCSTDQAEKREEWLRVPLNEFRKFIGVETAKQLHIIGGKVALSPLEHRDGTTDQAEKREEWLRSSLCNLKEFVALQVTLATLEHGDGSTDQSEQREEWLALNQSFF
jgi:hypothetical protein